MSASGLPGAVVEQARFVAVAETAKDAIISVDARGDIVYWNRAAEVLFGWTRAEIQGHGLKEIIPERFRDQHDRGMVRVRSGGEAHVLGRTVELMVAEGEGRKDAATRRLSGRARDNRLVHFVAPDTGSVRPGDVVEVEVTYAAPHHLVSDAPVRSARRTRSGDAWEARQGLTSAPGVMLGLPTVGVPAPLAPVTGCG